MKRGILCLVLAAFFALPALAAAEVNGVYIAPRFLVGIQDSGSMSTSEGIGDGFSQHSQAVVGGALAVGYNFAPKSKLPVRAEIEYALRSNSSNSKDGRVIIPASTWETKHTLNISTLFVNAYFDIDTGTAFTPYIGAGAGMAFNYTGVKAEVAVPGAGSGSLSADEYDTTFAWNAGAGLSYAFTENVAADLGYRFIDTGYREVEKMGLKVGSAPYIHEFYLGARFTF